MVKPGIVAFPFALIVLLSGGCSTLKSLRPEPEVIALKPASKGQLAELSRQARRQFGSEKSAFYLLDENEEALNWRLALIDHAGQSIDIQYYLRDNNDAGRLLMLRLLDAGTPCCRRARMRGRGPDCYSWESMGNHFRMPTIAF